MNGYDVWSKPAKAGTSGNAQVLRLYQQPQLNQGIMQRGNHPELLEVQYSPSTLHKDRKEHSVHGGEYIKLTYSEGNTDQHGNKKVYVISPEFRDTASKSTFYNQDGQRLEYVNGIYQVVE